MSVINVTDPDDGRNRRQVKFRSDDMHFSDLDESDNQEDDDESDLEDNNPTDEAINDSDSEWSDSDEESKDKKLKEDKSRFYGRSFGKENEIRKKIANELAKLDKINQESNIKNFNDQEQDDSDGSMEYDEDSDDHDDSQSDAGFEDNESDEDGVLNDSDNKKPKTKLGSEVLTNDLQKTDEDTTLNWKKNLALKATNAYYERQNSVANLWKLVYGKLFIVIIILLCIQF